MTKIKLCGLTRMEDIAAVNELRPEYVGFVFWEKSRRNVSRDKARELRKALLPQIRAVGVFVDEPLENVSALLRDDIIDIAQLHGNENEEYIEKLRALSPESKIIQAFRIRAKEDVERAIKSSADYLLLDSGSGSGKNFNWELIKGADFGRPFFLAGGLDADNVEEAILYINPDVVDVSSGIESDGVKDLSKMRMFTSKVRGVKNE